MPVWAGQRAAGVDLALSLWQSKQCHFDSSAARAAAAVEQTACTHDGTAGDRQTKVCAIVATALIKKQKHTAQSTQPKKVVIDR